VLDWGNGFHEAVACEYADKVGFRGEEVRPWGRGGPGPGQDVFGPQEFPRGAGLDCGHDRVNVGDAVRDRAGNCLDTETTD
jgi:hypothetical protein